MNTLQFFKNKKVLITGHTGFKGMWLSIWLHSLGARVFGYSLPDISSNFLYTSLKNKTNRLHESICTFEDEYFADIREQERLKSFVCSVSPDMIFHLAAQPLVINSYQNPHLTWTTNVVGTLNLLSSLAEFEKLCSVCIVTTDKVYKNKNWSFGYRENDELGGHDPYSASKAACELLSHSWDSSFLRSRSSSANKIGLGTARSGNVIGGGDWSANRLVPDIFRAIQNNDEIRLRNPKSTRPWQHVLEPLYGYLLMNKHIYVSLEQNTYTSSGSFVYNFGPSVVSNKSVHELTTSILRKFGDKRVTVESINYHEADKLNLQADKAYHELGWTQLWNFDQTIERTALWYKEFENKHCPLELCLDDIKLYEDLLLLGQ